MDPNNNADASVVFTHLPQYLLFIQIELYQGTKARQVWEKNLLQLSRYKANKGSLYRAKWRGTMQEFNRST